MGTKWETLKKIIFYILRFLCFSVFIKFSFFSYTEEEIEAKVTEYRQLLTKQKEKAEAAGALTSSAVDAFGRPIAQDSHQIAELQMNKNMRLRQAFGIPDDYVDGSSLEKLKRKEVDEPPQTT